MILCATRTSETARASWNEIDLSAQAWTVPGVRMKHGVDHRIPLSPRCVDILTRAAALGSQQYVFPGRSTTKPITGQMFLRVTRRMKRDDITAHGFRSSFRDWAAEQTNVPRAVCEAALAHTISDRTEAAHNRTDLFERRRELMTAWSAFATGAAMDNGA